MTTKKSGEFFWHKAWRENSYNNKTLWIVAWILFFLGPLIASMAAPIIWFKLKKKDPQRKPLTPEGKKMRLVTYGVLGLTLVFWFFALTSPVETIPENQEMIPYEECLQQYEAEYCNQSLYHWCVENIEYGEGHCNLYLNCLRDYQNEEYCFYQYFEFIE